MLHLFYIQSYITLEASLRHIEECSIPKSECLFLSSREINNTYGIRHLQVQECQFLLKWKNYNPLEFRKKLRSLILMSTNGEQYVYYTPNLSMIMSAAFINHKKCSGYHLLEEGCMSYFDQEFEDVGHRLASSSKFSLVKLKTIFKRIIYCFFHYAYFFSLPQKHPIRYENKKYLGVVKLHDEAFPGFPNSILSNPTWTRYDNTLPREKVEILLIFDALVEYDLAHPYVYINLLFNKCLDVVLSTGCSVVYYKLHPALDEITDVHFNSDLYSFKLVKLDSQVCLESLTKRDNAHIVYCLSSVALYSNVDGVKRHSIFKELETKDEKFSDYLSAYTIHEKEKLTKLLRI